jgi:hypothetical protein
VSLTPQYQLLFSIFLNLEALYFCALVHSFPNITRKQAQQEPSPSVDILYLLAQSVPEFASCNALLSVLSLT